MSTKEITVKVTGYDSRTYPSDTSVSSILQDIDSSLADNAVAAMVNGQLWDWNRSVESDAELSPVYADSEEGHSVLLHSAAHLMAQSVNKYFPDAQMTIGPTIENRFYYDFDVETPFSDEDLEKIENGMREYSAENYSVNREEIGVKVAKKLFKGKKETY
jgi:threonyl-tRNA synthetase